MEKGHFCISIRSDKKLNQIIRENGLVHKLTIQNNSHQRYIDIRFYVKHRVPKIYRQIFGTISQNPENVELFCNIMENPFHLLCRKWI